MWMKHGPDRSVPQPPRGQDDDLESAPPPQPHTVGGGGSGDGIGESTEPSSDLGKYKIELEELHILPQMVEKVQG